jgi:hypothetical protein
MNLIAGMFELYTQSSEPDIPLVFMQLVQKYPKPTFSSGVYQTCLMKECPSSRR